MKLNFITSQSLKNISGGWSGNSFNIYTNLKKYYAINYIGPINPNIPVRLKLWSKLIRILGLRSKIYYFSNIRLKKIKDQIRAQMNDSNYDFFMGATPWVKFNPCKPYGAFLDASVKTYFNNNIQINDFSKKDIARIVKAEKQWMENATHLFWASTWAKDEAIKQYNLKSNNHRVIGIGGNLEIPEGDSYKGELLFLFIAQNFSLKGGETVFETFKELKKYYPESKLVILGQKPPDYVVKFEGVEYPGYLNKNITTENAKFIDYLSRAFCLIHPTTSDTIAQVIIECGYFGCPAIAPKIFAIPELIIDGKTGYLVDTPFNHFAFKNKVEKLIKNKTTYQNMRRNTRHHYIQNYSYPKIVKKIQSIIGFND